jgi:hypothetical protein
MHGPYYTLLDDDPSSGNPGVIFVFSAPEQFLVKGRYSSFFVHTF